MKIEKEYIDDITMCPYCKRLFDKRVGDKFKSGEIKRRWGEKDEDEN